MDIKALMSSIISAEIIAGITDLDAEEATARSLRADHEAAWRASLAELDDDRVDELEGRLRACDRELARIAEQRKQLKVRLEEVQLQEAAVERDALVKRGEAARDKGLKAYARYEALCAELAETILPVIQETERQVKEINSELAKAGDARKVRTPIGVLVDQRGTADRVDVPGYAKLPAVIGQHHFWPRPR